jgi:hypothetical protein
VVRSGDCHAVLATSVSEAGTDEYVCDSNVHEDRFFVLLLGNDTSAARIPISRYHKLRTEDNIYELLSSTTILAICRMQPPLASKWRPLPIFESNFGFRSDVHAGVLLRLSVAVTSSRAS